MPCMDPSDVDIYGLDSSEIVDTDSATDKPRKVSNFPRFIVLQGHSSETPGNISAQASTLVGA